MLDRSGPRSPFQRLFNGGPKGPRQEDPPGQLAGIEPVCTRDCRTICEMKGKKVPGSTLAHRGLINRSL